MSLQLAAKHLASKGRGPDSTLVHMAPNEVAGLQALAKAHGGALTVNPETGLPEASFLSAILPAVAGFALGPAGFGLMSPLMAGATVGGISALTSGNLGKGLMAGMGAYGGAGLGAGLVGMGEQSMLAPMNEAAAAAAKLGDPTGGLAGVDPQMLGQASQASNWDKAVAGAKYGWNNPDKLVSGLGGGSTKQGLGYLAAAATPTVMEALVPKQTPSAGFKSDAVMPQRLEYNPRTGRYDPISASQAFQMRHYADGGTTGWRESWNPDTPDYGQQNRDFGREILYYDMLAKNNPEEVKKSATEGVNTGLDPNYTPSGGGGDYGGGPGGATFNSGNYTGIPGALFGKTAEEAANTPVVDMSSYGKGTVSPVVDQALASYAESNNSAPAPKGSDTTAAESGYDPGGDGGGRGGVGAGIGVGGQAEAGSDAPGATFNANGGLMGHASGGISSLGSYSDGGQLLRGPGDGVSDDIPATIGENQPARLADGEFVIPARIVSELGNGSTEAGSRKLYAMMDRIQRNRQKSIGKDRVAVNSKADRYLPA